MSNTTPSLVSSSTSYPLSAFLPPTPYNQARTPAFTRDLFSTAENVTASAQGIFNPQNFSDQSRVQTAPSLSAVTAYPLSGPHYQTLAQGPAVSYSNNQPVLYYTTVSAPTHPSYSGYLGSFSPSRLQRIAQESLMQRLPYQTQTLSPPVSIYPASAVETESAAPLMPPAPLANFQQTWIPFEQGKSVQIITNSQTGSYIVGKMASLDYNKPITLQTDTGAWLEKTKNSDIILRAGTSLYATEEIEASTGMRVFTIETPIDQLELEFGDRLTIPFYAPEPAYIIVDYTQESQRGTNLGQRGKIYFNSYSESVSREIIRNLD